MFEKIDHETLINQAVDRNISNTYVTSKEINDLLKLILMDIGIDMFDISDRVFTDTD